VDGCGYTAVVAFATVTVVVAATETSIKPKQAIGNRKLHVKLCNQSRGYIVHPFKSAAVLKEKVVIYAGARNLAGQAAARRLAERFYAHKHATKGFAEARNSNVFIF